ncbi:MAG: hypothetical protein AJITA_00197 [Acetilactobacillus jinshanensis]
MSKLVPENMAEVRIKLNDLKQTGKKIDPNEFISHVVLQLFQIYLDDAEEGHYDTAKMINPHMIKVHNTNNSKIGQVPSKDKSFAKSFRKNSLFLRIQLEDQADQIAIQNS